MKKAICKKCGKTMNIPKSHATLCYDCENKKQFYYECPDCGYSTDQRPTKECDTTAHNCETGERQ